MSSRASTVRRRVGRSKRESCGTTTSERTIGSVPVETDVPLALRKCITLLDEIGLDAEGLYRIPGTATSIERLRPAFSGAALYDHDVHVVAGVIKGFLREGLGPKKIPVCTFDLYERFISATRKSKLHCSNRLLRGANFISDLVHSLPANHFATLKLVCEHLARVASHSEKNRMSVRNLAIIFGPSLL
ncbi:Rho GTPase activation protein, partial [Phlyctochytrium arcticum]